jgi:hypothetical protein
MFISFHFVYDIIYFGFHNRGGFMLNKVSLIMSIVVIGIVYIVLFKIIRIMYLDLKGIKPRERSIDYALEVVDAPDNSGIVKGNVYPIHTVTNIGRKEENHIAINDPYVSGNHARVFINNGRLFIKDLNSTNGTIKNNRIIRDVEELYNGDIIEIGRVIFKVIG